MRVCHVIYVSEYTVVIHFILTRRYSEHDTRTIIRLFASAAFKSCMVLILNTVSSDNDTFNRANAPDLRHNCNSSSSSVCCFNHRYSFMCNGHVEILFVGEAV